MDNDLFIDIFSFLPEKYFIFRNLDREYFGAKTRASFTDYARNRYRVSAYFENWIDGRRESPTFYHARQEYGPYQLSPSASEFLRAKFLKEFF